MNLDQSIEAANQAQEFKVLGWNQLALELLRAYSNQTKDFITEDFRAYAESNGLEKPSEPRAYGSVIRAAINANIIKHTGAYREMSNKKSHKCIKKVWTKVIITQEGLIYNFFNKFKTR